MKIFKLYMMEKDNDENSLEELNQRYIKAFCRRYDGCTVYKNDGYWVSPDGKLYQEKGLICEVFVDIDKHFKGNMEEFVYDCKSIARKYKREAGQLMVSLVVDGQAYIID